MIIIVEAGSGVPHMLSVDYKLTGGKPIIFMGVEMVFTLDTSCVLSYF